MCRCCPQLMALVEGAVTFRKERPDGPDRYAHGGNPGILAFSFLSPSPSASPSSPHSSLSPALLQASKQHSQEIVDRDLGNCEPK